MRVRIIVFEYEILEAEVVDVSHLRVDSHGWELSRFPCQLQLSLFDVIGVEMHVSEGMNEVTRFVIEDLRNHHCKKGIARNVERNAKKKVCTSLVELAREAGAPPLGLMNIELEEEVTGRKGHLSTG